MILKFNRILLIISLLSIGFSITVEDLSNEITIDGISNELDYYDRILIDDNGKLLESPQDSRWDNPEYNDVKQIKVTWDSANLYLAVDACSYGNNVLLFIDIYDSYGIENMSQLNNLDDSATWRRSFSFYNLNPDFFVGTWDTNDTPQFWKVEEGGTSRIEQIFEIDGIETSATFDTNNLDGAMEIKIPFSVLSNDANGLLNFNKIKLLAAITGDADYNSGPDCAPDNLGGMAYDDNQIVTLDNYVEITIDDDGDSSADIGISPRNQSEYLIMPPIKPEALTVQNVIFENGKTFSPILDGAIEFELELDKNRVSDFSVKIFDLNGNFINLADNLDGFLNWSWDGKDQIGNLVPFGIYILCFIADSGEIRHNEAVVVIK